ncbi:AKIP1 protein, partial [Daphoenositta chrysoptera]|nr:AKIP1 protein [Daphoenositta chrysoptera]
LQVWFDASHIIFSVDVQKYYGSTPVRKCKENEIKHFCKYHGKKIEIKLDSTGEEVSSFFFLFFSKPRRPSKDFYIEVSPGVYSVTATSEDMVEQTHIVDVIAGQSIDLTFVL